MSSWVSMNRNFCIAIFSVLINRWWYKRSKLIDDQYWFYFDIQKKTNKTNSVSGLVSTFFFWSAKRTLGCAVCTYCLLFCLPTSRIYLKENGTYYNCMLSFSDIFRSLNSWKFSPLHYCKKSCRRVSPSKTVAFRTSDDIKIQYYLCTLKDIPIKMRQTNNT